MMASLRRLRAAGRAFGWRGCAALAIVLALAMLAWVPSATPQDETKERVFGASDVYIVSWECGYLNERDGLVLPCDLVVIDGQEQLDYAKREWGLADSAPFLDMTRRFSLEDHFYLLEYQSVGSGGYNLRADRVRIEDGSIGFLLSDDSYSPGEYELVPDIVSGFLHMAAIPRSLATSSTFRNVIYPGEGQQDWGGPDRLDVD